jgi:hypothetical protein
LGLRVTPSAATAALVRDIAATLLDPHRSAPPGLRAWNGSDPATRLAVYRNNVVSSLVDAMGETFPVVRQLVGEEFFRAMAGVFVREMPPRTRVLAHYGGAFPSFVASFAPARALSYLPDVARLEFARVMAYHAADADPVADEIVTLALGSGERMGELCMALHPSVHTLSSPHAVVSLWAAHQLDVDDEIGAVDVDMPESALILRTGLDVLVLPVPPGTVEFVEAIRAGLNLGDAAAQAASRAAAMGSAFDLTAILTPLLAHGALISIHLPPRLTS